MSAVLRATNEAGETYDDPSEDLLFIMLEELATPGNSFLIVERLDSGRAGHFMQTVIGADGSPFILEYREGPQETHHSTAIDSMRTVHEVFTRWAFDLPGWQDNLDWQPVSY